MNENEEKTNDNEGRDEDAVRRLVAENLNLVRKEAWRMARARACGETAAEQAALAGELAQAGVLGLRRAAEKFDPGLGYALSTYAMPWIRKTEGAAADEWSRMRTGRYVCAWRARASSRASAAAIPSPRTATTTPPATPGTAGSWPWCAPRMRPATSASPSGPRASNPSASR